MAHDNKQMNVLWIMTDQLQAGCLGFMGNQQVQTPHLDTLAARSYVFDRAFVQSPVCMASRASIFTGRYPSAVRVRGMGILPPDEITLPETLRRQGYATGAFGKVHLTPELFTRTTLQSDVPILDWQAFAEPAHLKSIPPDPHKSNYGFEKHIGCDDLNRGLYEKWVQQGYGAVTLAGEPLFPEWIKDLFVAPVPAEWHHSTFIATAAENDIRQQGKSPWFNYCSFIHPHHPFEAPQELLDLYPLEDIVLPQDKGQPNEHDIPQPAASAIGEFLRFPDIVQRAVLRHYYASITLIDQCVGRLLQALHETGQAENTIIIFTADHGEMAGEHGLLRKPSIHYDELLQVPLMISLPDTATSGRRIPGLVELVDLYPTLMGLLGLESHPGVQGTDWSRALTNNAIIGHQDIYSDMLFDTPSGPYRATQTLRSEDWKLSIYPTAGSQFGQLFDLKNDPNESTNLYHDTQYSPIRQELLWQLSSRQARQVDPLPLRLSQW